MPEKHGIAALVLALKEAEIKTEAIQSHIHQGKTSTKQRKDKVERSTVMLFSGQINETTTLYLPTY